MAKTTLTLDIGYDPELTDAEALSIAMDRLLETALSTPGIMQEYGDPQIGEFLVAGANDNQRQLQPEPDDDMEVRRRWVLYDLDTDALLTTRVYASYEDAADDASHVNDVVVLPLVCQGVIVRPHVQPAPHDPQEPGHGQP